MSDATALQRRRELTRERMRKLRARRRDGDARAGDQLLLFNDLAAISTTLRKSRHTCGNRVTCDASPVENGDAISRYCAGVRARSSVATGSGDHPLFDCDRENRKEGAPSTPPDGGEAFVRYIVRTATERLRPWQRYLDRSEGESRRRMLYAIDLELKAANLKVTKATIARAIDRERKASRAPRQA